MNVFGFVSYPNLFKMSDSHEKFSTEIDETQCGFILGCWDHEKTSTLIQDLEETVNLVERKCVKLFEELVYYKKYLKESRRPNFDMDDFRRKSKKLKNSSYFSGSEPDITFQRTLLNIQKVQQGFEEKFQAKLWCINSELTEAAKKMGLKENVILFPPNDFPEVESKSDTEKSLQDLQESFTQLNLVRSKTKSNAILTNDLEESEFSKITKDELQLYQKLSRLSVKRKRKERKVNRKIITFRVKRKTPRHRQHFIESKTEKNQTRKNGQKLKNRRTAPHGSFSPSTSDSFLKHSLEKLNISEAEKKLSEVLDKIDLQNSGDETKGYGDAEDGLTFGTASKRRPSTFNACGSVSRSHNRHGKEPKTRKPLWETKDFESDASGNSTKAEKRRSILWSVDSKNGHFEKEVAGLLKEGNSKSEHEKSGNWRKVRSKYTGRSPEGFLLGHKSTMSRYTRGQKSLYKSESSTAYLVGSKIMVSDCRRTDVFQFETDNSLENASGDGVCVERCDKLNTGWTKAYDSFSSIYRRYTLLKEKLKGTGFSFSDEDLKSLENELDYSIEKYKEFLQFYSKFLHLNHRLKCLKTTCESNVIEPSSSFLSKCTGKLCTYRSTYSITMKKALREVQALQDKIKLVNA